MHFEILVEDRSGARALEILLPKLVSTEDSFRIHAYKGIGRIPKNMRDTKNASKRILLENLPKLLKGYGKTFQAYPTSTPASVVVVCDLDDEPFSTFLQQLNKVLSRCHPAPTARFCIAIEEGEAWLLGDTPAIKTAYPSADDGVLSGYVNDSICGTWEVLADAVYPGGTTALSEKGFVSIGAEKFAWADRITPNMDIEANLSPSFSFFRNTIRTLSQHDVA